MEAHERVGLYLDRDAAGQNCSRNALASNGRYRDESNAYEGFKDFNEWLVGSGRDNRRRQRQKL